MDQGEKGNKVVLGIYDSKPQVEAAIDTLKLEGFRNSDISVLMPQKGNPLNFAHIKESKAPEGATTGASTGAVLGGAMGWLVGIGAIATIPALGPLVAAGPIMAALSGAALGGATGGVVGALVGFGIPEYEAKRYESFVKDGGILLSVHADDKEWADKAEECLRTSGGHDISTTTEASSETTKSFREKYRSEERNF